MQHKGSVTFSRVTLDPDSLVMVEVFEGVITTSLKIDNELFMLCSVDADIDKLPSGNDYELFNSVAKLDYTIEAMPVLLLMLRNGREVAQFLKVGNIENKEADKERFERLNNTGRATDEYHYQVSDTIHTTN